LYSTPHKFFKAGQKSMTSLQLVWK